MRIGDFSVAAVFVSAMILAGCNSTEDSLRPLPKDVEAAGATSTDPLAQPIILAGSIRFTPIIGAPIEAITPLSRQLSAEAKARGFTILASNEQNSEQVLKGYLSAFNDGQQTAVIYVWDVLDQTGKRLHRIQGQENIPGAAADAWASVPASTMERIATRIFDDYQSWLQQKPV